MISPKYMSAFRWLRSLSLVSIGLLCVALVWSQEKRISPPEQLYLLAATPDQDYGYPATLYRVVSGKLNVVRELSPQSEGVRSVRAWEGTIFLVHPAQVPRAVSIVHPDDPARVDDIEINPDWPQFFFVANEAIAEPDASSVDELMLATKGELSLANAKWLGISGAMASNPRIKPDVWDEYSKMRVEGEPGGPFRGAGLAGAVSGEGLLLFQAFGHPVPMGSLSPTVREAISQTAMKRVQITAASQDYLILELAYSMEETFSKAHSTDTELFVHDRARNAWATVRVEGNRSRLRLFGPWLAASVETFNPDGKPSPGRENERGPEAFGPEEIAGARGNNGNAAFPDVRNLYGGDSSANFIPGVLLLQNLADGQKIRIETGQEDSEVIVVRDDAVLYRVNDSLYQAKLAGDKLQGTQLVVKDEDVPEIHWAFWGPAISSTP
jgi:hypothetical protein